MKDTTVQDIGAQFLVWAAQVWVGRVGHPGSPRGEAALQTLVGAELTAHVAPVLRELEVAVFSSDAFTRVKDLPEMRELVLTDFMATFPGLPREVGIPFVTSYLYSSR